jgi:hypothetical protein
MATQQNFRVDSFVSGLAIKAPVKTISLVNIPSPAGTGDLVGGYIVAEGDRVLLAAQTDPIDNGIYTVETSAWQRAGDFDGNRDIVGGTIIPVWRQSMTDIVLYQVDGAPTSIIVGQDDIDIILFYDPTLAGIAEAPIDSTSYVRNNAGWVSESAGSLPSPAVSAVLAGDGAGNNWVVATDITINSASGALMTQSTLGATDGTNEYTLSVNAGVANLIGTVGISHVEQTKPWRNLGSIYIGEAASADTDFAALGQFWVESEVDNVPMFTSDAGTDQLLDPSRSDVNLQNGDYTTVLADKGKTIRKDSGGAGETYTIADEATVNYKIGTFIGFDNDGGGSLTIDIAGTDTLIFADTGGVGARTLGDGGFAVAFKNAAGQWKIAGKQLS